MVNRGVTGAGLAWAFTTFYAANWHPLTWISHMTDCQLFGTNAGCHLLVNTLIHVANTLLVFWFLLRTTHARWPSALVAALFALHPLHVESVAWASERKDTLCAFFGLLSLIAYVRYVEAPSISRYHVDCHNSCLGVVSQTDVSDLAFCNVVDRLLAAVPIPRPRSEPTWSASTERDGCRTVAIVAREIAVVHSRGGVSHCHFYSAIAWRRCAHIHRAPLRCGYRTRLSRMRNIFCSHSGQMISPFIIRSAGRHTGLADRRRSVPADWNHGILSFSAENPAVSHRGLALVSGNTGSRHRTRSGWRANHGGPLLLYSVNRFVHCSRVWISGHHQRVRVLRHRLAPRTAVGVLLVFATLTNAQIHRWRDSFTLFEHTLAVTPPNLHHRIQPGHCLGSKSGRYDEAAAHFEKALQIELQFLRRPGRHGRYSCGTRAGCQKQSSISKLQSAYSRTRRKRTCS